MLICLIGNVWVWLDQIYQTVTTQLTACHPRRRLFPSGGGLPSLLIICDVGLVFLLSSLEVSVVTGCIFFFTLLSKV